MTVRDQGTWAWACDRMLEGSTVAREWRGWLRTMHFYRDTLCVRVVEPFPPHRTHPPGDAELTVPTADDMEATDWELHSF
jgi:hypothetical protein